MAVTHMFQALRNSDSPVVKTGLITVVALAVAQAILCYAAGDAWATAYLWSVASVAAGAMLGFLFGVPKVLQDETTKTGGYRQLVNTNLDQISDWLTKVVVGLTLVNARDISKSLQGTAGILEKALGNKDGDLALAMAVVVYFSVIGFMSVYILTRLYLSPAFSEGDQAFQRAQQLLVEAHRAGTPEEAKKILDRIPLTIGRSVASEVRESVPKSGRPGDPVMISGTGFGAEKGTVSFGDAAVDMTTAKWADGEVTVNVPAAAKPGKVLVTLTPKGTDRKLVSSVEFEVLAQSTSPNLAGSEDSIDGCDVAITDATPDKDLPAAEGGIRR